MVPATQTNPMNSSEIDQSLKAILRRYAPVPGNTIVLVQVATQSLQLYQENQLVAQWPVSTSRFGIGNEMDSFKTPPGVHRIAEKIGTDEQLGCVFRARRRTGEIATIHNDNKMRDQDLITTRILWLEGLEQGVNAGPGIDSYQRFIYIHGTPEEGLIGQAVSHGCVRMRNQDVADLFSRIPVGSLVVIQT